MDTNTIIIVSADGFLSIFFIYAIVDYYRRVASKAVKPRPVVREAIEPRPVVREAIEPPNPSQNIINIEGIGPIYAEKLKKIGIETTIDLLEAGATLKGREELAEKTWIPSRLILEWVKLADLFRIKSVDEEYSDLLEEAGVDTVAELATRNPENLYTKLVEVNQEKKLVRRLMSQEQVGNWIEQAKKLPRKVEK